VRLAIELMTIYTSGSECSLSGTDETCPGVVTTAELESPKSVLVEIQADVAYLVSVSTDVLLAGGRKKQLAESDRREPLNAEAS